MIIMIVQRVREGTCEATFEPHADVLQPREDLELEHSPLLWPDAAVGTFNSARLSFTGARKRIKSDDEKRKKKMEKSR